jgi:cellulose synthase/poly-beta-1,6-N-acetylglucosamine synthase-like glycosyltransferase
LNFDASPQQIPDADAFETDPFRLCREAPAECARRTLTVLQTILLLGAVVLLVEVAVFFPMAVLLWLNVAFTVFYVAVSAYRVLLIDFSLARQAEIQVAAEEIAALRDEELPEYTILVPLYREAASLPNLARALDALDYPKSKLDVQLLLEADDAETIEAAKALQLGAHYRLVVVPHSLPKTKPKACNVGLGLARGKYLVIYDAEDRPEPDQLKKAIVGFSRAGSDVVCLQAKLNFYNQRQNWVTRWFTAEYSMWFDLALPGLGSMRAPIPLGGTSNHFITEKLRELRGWDAHNVAEDCDLGIRLARRGYRTRMLDTTTWEEACSQWRYWIRQRSRWVKGYIQTFLVHNRHPLRLMREIGWLNTLNFYLTVGGVFVGFLLNPIYWALAAVWFVGRWEPLTQLFPGAVFFLAATCLFLGNFVFVYACALGCARRGLWDLVKYALLIPPYWLMLSIGAWKGFLQLLFRPHYWEKTKHALFKEEKTG